MQAQLEKKRRRVMFPKNSVFVVVVLAAFVSLGALLLPQVAQAQDDPCLFDCANLGSDPSFNPWFNSPQGLDVAYCFDRDCVLKLKDGKGKQIFTGTSIPTPSVEHVPDFTCPGTGSVTISGTVLALLRDKKGIFVPSSAAQAELKLIILDAKCFPDPTRLSRVVGVNELRTDVFDPASSIIILPPTTPGTPASLTSKGKGWTGCPTDGTGTLSGRCLFPLGTEEFTESQLANQLPATTKFPVVGEVYRAVQLTKFVGVRDCKGDPQDAGVPPAPPPPPNPSTIDCSVGAILTGGNAQGLLTFEGNWSGANEHTINPNSGNNPFDILTDLLFDVDPNTVTASANDGPEVPNKGCNDVPSQGAERCFFSAKLLLPNGCTSGQVVNILVRGRLNILDPDGNKLRFVSKDDPICS
jgi:hypothetical protein